MQDDPPSRAGGMPAALSAFLRGAERRAFVFLWLQAGDAPAAERALAAAIRAFPGPAARMPMAEWPTRFWKLLLALPLEPGRDWPPALAFLGAMRPHVRRALLLRLVAGLDEATAAEVTGVDAVAYQQALAEACPRDPAGIPDAAGWRSQGEAIQQAGRDLDAAQLLRLMQLREAALAGCRVEAPAPVVAPAVASVQPQFERARRGPRRPGWRSVAAALAVAMLLGLAWWRWPPAPAASIAAGGAAAEVDDLRVHDHPPVVVEPLPPADPPEAADWPAPLPEPLQDPVVAELGLLSWYAAGAGDSRLEREDDGRPALAMAATATADDGIAAAAALEAWQQLDAFEQAQVRAAAAMLQGEPADVQAQLRARFAALDAMERRGWRLGPVLGADYVGLQPLVGFVPEDERAPLLAALRALQPAQRAQLGDLAKRTPPASREALRRELLATAPSQRGAWLAQRAAQ